MKKDYKSYITNIKLNSPLETGEDIIKCRLLVDLKAKTKGEVKAFYHSPKAKNSKWGVIMTKEYYKIVIPVGIVIGNILKDKTGKTLNLSKIKCLVSFRPKKQIELDITPVQIIKQFITCLDKDFNENAQVLLLREKKDHWEVLPRQVQWIHEVNRKINISLPDEKIKVSIALLQNAWDRKSASRTLAVALPQLKLILFNQSYFLSLTKEGFVDTYLHELAHIISYEKSKYYQFSGGHDATWINCYDKMCRKVFEPDVAKFILAYNLKKYAGAEITTRSHSNEIMDFLDYLNIKEQTSLQYVAIKNHWKLPTDNEEIKNFQNKVSEHLTPINQFLNLSQNKKLSETFYSFNMKQVGQGGILAKIDHSVDFATFGQNTTNKNNQEAPATEEERSR